MLYGLTALALTAATGGTAGGGGLPPVVGNSMEAFRAGTYRKVVRGNVAFTVIGLVVRRLLRMQFVRVFGMFLLGVWAGRVGLFADLAAHRPLFNRLLLAGAAVGLPGSVAFALLPAGGPILPTIVGWPRAAVESVATPFLALGYALALALLFTRARWQRYLRIFAPVGRMALTNYLLQSVVLVGAFYGIGLGLWRRVSHTTALLLAIAVFALQVPLSAFWLRRYSYGPVEWVWRQFTYGLPDAARAGRRETYVMLRSSAALLALVLLPLAACSRVDDDVRSDARVAAANVHLVRRTVEDGYNGRNPEIFDAAYHPDAVVWNNGTRMDDGPILEGFRRDLQDYDRQFSDWRIDIEDIFGTADRVAVRWVFHGRLRANGQRVSRTGNWIGRILNGQVAEVWEHSMSDHHAGRVTVRAVVVAWLAPFEPERVIPAPHAAS